jgi:prepilin signal peptidase PulO-like enzyme (type II secretory pathway)
MLFLLFLLGLGIGSYANVVIFRLARNENPNRGRSRCLNCGETLSWYDNIPLFSFVFLLGRCRHCQQRFSWQYPLVELTLGLGFLASGFLVLERFGTAPEAFLILGWMLVTITLLLLITVYDLRYMEIPVLFLWLANVSTLGFLLFFKLAGFHSEALFPHSVSSSLLGAFTAGGFLLLLVSLSRETWMGWGDVWLGTWGGMILGLSLVQPYLTLAFALGACVGIWFLSSQKKGLKSQIPFAPYLLFALIVIFLLEWYSPEIFSFLLPWFPATI